MSQPDLTTTEIRAELLRIQKRIGPSAYISVGFGVSDYDRGEKPHGHCAPKGMARGDSFSVDGATWREVVEAIEAGWDERQATYEAETTRRLALAIIDITNRIGECSDAALRGDGFNHTEVKRFGPTACALATEMAAGGPFAIVPHDAKRNEPLEAA